MSSSSGLPALTTAAATSNSPSNSPSTAATSASAGSSNQSSGKSSAAAATSSQGSSAASSASGLPNIGDTTSASSSSSLSISHASDAPSLTSTNNGGGILSLSGLPTLSGAFSYPPASVPPVSAAPFMRTTQLPENFVFIVVGSVLAFLMLVVVLWRFISAWSINRSFKKDAAAMYTPLPDLKKKPTKAEGAMDLADLSGAKLPKSFNSVPNLFFSPTAEVARQSMIRPQSQHMPSGHYRDASRG